MARQKSSGCSPEQRGQRDRRTHSKPHRRTKQSQCFCDQCEGVMPEGLVYGPDDGFDGWGAND